MNRFIQKNKFILVLLAIVICLSCAYGLTVKLDPTVNAASSKVSASDYSWATMSQAAAQYLGQTAAPEGSHGRDVSTPDPKTGFAGGFLGYLTPGDDESRYTVASLESANTVSYSYATLAKLNDSMNASGGGDNWSKSAQIYAGYGYALTSSGIDEPVIIGQTADDKRNAIGPIVLIVFLLCVALPEFFKMVLTFLSVANPFRLFLGAGSVLRSIVPSIQAGGEFTNKSTNSEVLNAMSNALNTLADTVTGLYNVLYNLSFAAVIPIMIALALFAWLVLRKSAGSVFKNLIIRVVFIGLGVPLMLACYTAAIDSVKDFTINGALGTPVTLITSTFCDYGSWMLGKDVSTYNYASLPNGVNLYVDQSTSTYKYKNTSTGDRRLVQLINEQVNSNFAAGGNALSSGTSATDIANDDSKLVNSVGGLANENVTSDVINLLQRYTKGEYITASSFATKINNRFNSTTMKEKYMIQFNQSAHWRDFDPNEAVAYKYESEDGTFNVDVTEDQAKEFAKVRLTTSGIAGSANLFYGLGSGGTGNTFSLGSYTGSTSALPPFSEMAIYNMLSSTFSDTSITVYSTTATSTNQVQLAHYAVSIAGQGYMEIAYVVDAIAIMACLMLLGYGYGFALLFACFKGLIQIFPKVLTGMIGSIKGIAGSVALIAAMIIEIIGTCIMYALGSLFIGKIYDLIEIPLAKLLSSGGLGLPPEAASLVTVVASAIIIFKLTMTLLKYRTAVVKSVSETATAFINKFMQTNVVAPNLESDMSAGNLASIGLGMAMVATSTPAGSKLADRASELTDKVANTDADKVATAAMGGSTLTGEHGEKYANAADAEAAKAENDTHSDVSAASGGHYDSNVSSVSDTPSTKTSDDIASDYVENNGADFEKSIGYSSSGDENTSSSGGLADNSDNLKNQSINGKITGSDGTVEEYEDGRLVTKYDANGKKIVDNSTEEITGTKTTDVSSITSDDTETGNKSAGKISSGDTQSSSAPANKMIMTDSNGNQQEVSIVNAKTGAAYTQADKDAGANYDVIGSDGKSIYGNLSGGMSANTIGMQNGEATVMIAPGSGGTNSFGGGGMYTLSQAPVPELQAPVQAGSGTTTQNVTQNVTNINQGTTQQQSQTVVQTEASAGNSGSAPVNINVAANNVTPATPMNMPAGGGSGATYVNVNTPVSGGGRGGSSAPVSTNTVERETVQTVMNQTTESVVYQDNGNSAPSMPTGGSSQGNTFVTNNHNTVNNQNSVNNQNNTNNNVNNQSNTTNNSGGSSFGGLFGSGSDESRRRK